MRKKGWSQEKVGQKERIRERERERERDEKEGEREPHCIFFCMK